MKSRNPGQNSGEGQPERPRPKGSGKDPAGSPTRSRATPVPGADADDIRRIVYRAAHTSARQRTPPASPNMAIPAAVSIKPHGLRQRLAVFLRNRQRRKARRRISPTMRAVKRILVVLLVLVLFLGASAFAIWEYMLGQISRPSETSAFTAGGTTRPVITAVPLTNPPPEVKGVTNLLLLGVDNRVTGADDAESLSDVMMIVTVDADNKVIKLTSLQRDMLVYVPGSVEPMKLTEAHLFGGPEMTMRVINENFRLDLKDYVEVNIYDSERLIDIVGGIDLTISAEILKSTNDCIVNQNAYFPDTPKAPTLKAGGMQHLNGRQAVAYARVRAVDSDYKRMGRQREVLQAVFYAFMDASLGSKGTMIKEGLGCIYTTLDNSEITRLAITVAPAMAKSVMQMQIPDPALFGMDKEFVETIPYYMIRVDLNGVIPKLQKFIYNRTFAFDPVRDIPGAPNAKLPLPAGHKVFTGVESLTPAPTTAATTVKPAATAATIVKPAATAAAATAAPTPIPTPAPTTAAPTTAAPTTAATTTAATNH